MVTSVKVRAPSSTANLGPGFDVFGLALIIVLITYLYLSIKKCTLLITSAH